MVLRCLFQDYLTAKVTEKTEMCVEIVKCRWWSRKKYQNLFSIRLYTISRTGFMIWSLLMRFLGPNKWKSEVLRQSQGRILIICKKTTKRDFLPNSIYVHLPLTSSDMLIEVENTLQSSESHSGHYNMLQKWFQGVFFTVILRRKWQK